MTSATNKLLMPRELKDICPHALASPRKLPPLHGLLQSRLGPPSLEQMRELAANVVEASFLSPERKVNLLPRVEQYGF
jgi:hypothetical protein